jgi:hypothetical protein
MPQPGHTTQFGSKTPQIPLYESNIHILVISQKSPYNPNQYATQARKPSNLTAQIATAKKPETRTNHA